MFCWCLARRLTACGPSVYADCRANKEIADLETERTATVAKKADMVRAGTVFLMQSWRVGLNVHLCGSHQCIRALE